MPKDLVVIKESNKKLGDKGELEVVELVNCPNCSSKLMLLPPSFPLVDVQCTRCNFRAQIKTNNTSPKNEIFGATWDVMDKILKSGYFTPPLIVNFKWEDKSGKHQVINFYPFIPKKNLRMRQLSSTARRANLKMFNYIKLNELPTIQLYKL